MLSQIRRAHFFQEAAILKVRETQAHPYPAAKQKRIARKSGSAVAHLLKRRFDPGKTIIQVPIALACVMLAGKSSREQGRVRRKRPRGWRDGILEEHSLRGQAVQIRASRTSISVGREVISAKRVYHNHNHIRAFG